VAATFLLDLPLLAMRAGVISEIERLYPSIAGKFGNPSPFLNTPRSTAFIYGFIMNGRCKSAELEASLMTSCRHLQIFLYIQHLVFPIGCRCLT
jgi:hypothetical protein